MWLDCLVSSTEKPDHAAHRRVAPVKSGGIRFLGKCSLHCDTVSLTIHYSWEANMPKLFVTILKYNTQAKQADSLTARKKVIEDALRLAQTTVQGKMKASDNGRPVWCIFAAPEYMFANPIQHGDHTAGDVRHLSDGTKVSIEAWLEGLSLKYPKFLLFPGSIAWKKPLQRSLGAYEDKMSKLQSTSNLTKQQISDKFKSKAVTRKAKAIQAIQLSMATFHNNNQDRSVSGEIYHQAEDDINGVTWYQTKPGSGFGQPGWYGLTWTANHNEAWIDHKAPTSRTKLAELGGAGKATKMARNTCLVYLNGKRLLKYNKAQDFHEVLDGNQDTVYVPGQTAAHFRTADGVTYGLELCLDHLEESLRKKLIGTGVVPQVIVLMSAQVTMDPGSLANPGAMAIHACSNPGNNLVGRGGVDLADSVLEEDKPTYALYSFDSP